MNLSESKDFQVSSASLKEVRTFSRDVFEKIDLPQDQKDELVLAIAEAAQNIVKHGYKGIEQTTDRMEIKISLNDTQLEIGFYDIKPTGDGHKIFQNQKTFFQWHKEGFTVPKSCDILALGETFPQQAFNYKNAVGIQFHPEVNLRMHLRWLYFAGYMLREKGAQKRHYQMQQRLSHGKKSNM